MNFLWEGLNPIYIWTAIILVTYLHIVGLAMNKKIGTTIPSILMGLLTSLLIFAPIIIPAHWGILTNYKVIYIILIIIVSLISVRIIIKEKINIKINKYVLLSILIFYIISLMFKDTYLLNSDYWLYGQWFNSGSNFISNNTTNTSKVIYMFTTMYTWIASFMGMISGGVNGVTSGVLNASVQTVSVILFASMMIQFASSVIKKVNYPIFILAIAFVSFNRGSYQAAILGQHCLPMLIIIIMNDESKGMRNSIFAWLTFLFISSTTIIISPLVLITLLVKKYNFGLKENILKWTMPFVISSIFIVIAINSTSFNEQGSSLSFYSRVWKLRYSIIAVSVISILGRNKIKNLLLINSIFVIASNLIVNYNWNLTKISSMPSVVMHRYLNFTLVGEYYDASVLIITLPWAMHLLYEHYKTKKDLK